MLGPVLRICHWEHRTTIPRSFGTAVTMIPAPGFRIAYPQPTELLKDHMWSLPTEPHLYPREGPVLLSYPLLMPKNPLELLRSPCVRPCLPVHILPLAPGSGPCWILGEPGFCSHLQQRKKRKDEQVYPLDNLDSIPRLPSSWDCNFFPSRKMVLNYNIP